MSRARRVTVTGEERRLLVPGARFARFAADGKLALGRVAADGTITLDLGVADVHQPGAAHVERGAPTAPEAKTMAEISTKKRNALPGGKFALPETRQYPINDAAHVRNAAARLEQMRKAGKISSAKYAKARAAIARAAKRFGVKSQYNAKQMAEVTASPAMPNAPLGVRVRAQLGAGGSLSVRHLSAREREEGTAGVVIMAEDGDASVPLESVLLADSASSAPAKPVWIQLATPGVFKGHPSGPFELNARVFEQIIANFRALRNREIPVDYEHASEQPATEGSIPAMGAVACGWVKDLKVEGGNLYGLVYWNERAANQIRANEYKYISPAIRFRSRDRVTGAETGARLSSVALTNQPFLDGMAAVAARDVVHGADGAVFARLEDGELHEVVRAEDLEEALLETPGGEWVHLRAGDSVLLEGDAEDVVELGAGDGEVLLRAPLSALAHSANEYMPKVRAALRLHDLASPADAADALQKLRGLYDDAGGDSDALMNGVRLADFGHPLRDLVGAAPGVSWEDVFKRVQALIDAAMVKHVVIEHGGGEEDELGLDGEDEQMTAALTCAALNDNDEEIMRILRSNTQAKTTDEVQLNDHIAVEASERVQLLLKLKDAETRAAEAEKRAESAESKLKASETEVSTLTLKHTEAEAKVTAAEAELTELRAFRTEHTEKALASRVDSAFLTWKDKKGLTEAHKPHMLSMLRATPEAFEALYPAVREDKQHLLRDHVAPQRDPQPPTRFEGAAPEKDATPAKKISLTDLSRQIAKHRRIPLSEAQVIAMRMLNPGASTASR